MKFDDKGLIVAIMQDALTGDVLMQAYMNKEAFDKTMETGYMHFYSRSRKCLWKKGETSGNVQKVVGVKIDCDKDSVLFKVLPAGPSCHTGNRTCFFTTLKENKEADYRIIFDIMDTIKSRRENPVEGSYTNYLFDKGLDKILKKVGEETSETIIAAKNKDKKELTMEISDLIYHILVLMEEADLSPKDIYQELIKRFGKKPDEKYKNR
ncbi:MAG: bifunctional phosphoribosyl-AMP cyclohydrolase/phosphoribosyl-ATP diphosphatase HisIE [Bacillota bacterium]|jgi:phosphoribosyl-ATP pyrophosphohydrolase/phosphoribosyl-AMP cyclohydrolase|nr:bifunctional phosphoribosyl-AMP cyclohydrolase/phosphoribosyl-ATP diphosphatase HisIE [Bacillota bacterium]HHU43623.1 bifunctional phosphoribosyl-AMP cyclohydrolase/phosphoribosyl-ATP diphosphatase HisIE [Clostridiales bacterium]